MGEEPEDGRERSAAQAGADELARMGIDPRALGLEVSPGPGERPATTVAATVPLPPPAAPDRDSRGYRGVASVPAIQRPPADEPASGADHPSAFPPPPTPDYPSAFPPPPEPHYHPSAFPPPPEPHYPSAFPPPPGPAGPAALHAPAPRQVYEDLAIAPAPRGAGPSGKAAIPSGAVVAAPTSSARVTPLPPQAEPAVPEDPEESTLSRPLTGGASQTAAPRAAGESLERIAEVPPWRPPAGWRRAARAVSWGLVEPRAAEAIQQERQLLARVRTRRPEPRVIAFLASKGGVGTTTTAAGVALTLATVRTDTTALISARTDGGSLGQRLLGRPAPDVGAITHAADLDREPVWLRERLAVIDGAPWHSPVPRGQVVQLIEDLRERHPLTVVDVGNEMSEPAHGALGRADQIVLVTTVGQDALAATRTALSRVHQVDPYRLATVVVAVTCLHRRQYRRTVQRLRSELPGPSPRIVPVPYDPVLTTGDQLELPRIRPATREAYLRLAALAVEPGRSQEWFAAPTGVGGRG